jgi:hypothetical protein
MKTLISTLTTGHIDISMFIIRIGIFSIGANLILEMNIQSSILISSLFCVILFFTDKSFAKFIQNVNCPLTYRRKVYSRLILRIVLAIVLGVFSGISINAAFLIENNYLNSKLEASGFEFNYVLGTLILFFTGFEILHSLVKFWLAKQDNNDLLTAYKIYLNMFNDKYLPNKEKNTLIKVIKSLKNKDQDFNSIRIIMESILIKLQKKGDIPIELFNKYDRPNLTNCVKYLNGITIKLNQNEGIKVIKPEGKIVPENIAICFDYIITLTNMFSHENKHKSSENLYKSSIYCLFECLLWLKTEVDGK